MAYIDQLTQVNAAGVADPDIWYVGKPGDSDPDRRITTPEAAEAFRQRTTFGDAGRLLGAAFDLNTIDTQGLFNWTDSLPINAPPGTFATMLALRRVTASRSQLAIRSGGGTNRVHVRGFTAGAWTPWDQVWNSQDIPYETGTWTPVLTASTTNPTVSYGTRTGRYTRIGDRVFAEFDVPITTRSGGSGNAQISLPLVCVGTAAPTAIQTRNVAFGTGRTAVTVLPIVGVANSLLQTHGAATTQATVAIGDVADDSRIRGYAIYRAA